MNEPTYNYQTFKPAYYDVPELPGPGRGEPAPDFELHRLDGTKVRLSDFRGQRVVIETGSATCPMYVKGIETTNRLAEQFPDVKFIVLYVREAHPGERTTPHSSLEDKLAIARTLEARYGEHREVLVDPLDGAAHRALGGMPDMVYVLDEDGCVEWRADWMHPNLLAEVLQRDASDALLKREHFEPTKPMPWIALPSLFVGGWKALLDFFVGIPGLLLLHYRANRRFGKW